MDEAKAKELILDLADSTSKEQVFRAFVAAVKGWTNIEEDRDHLAAELAAAKTECDSLRLKDDGWERRVLRERERANQMEAARDAAYAAGFAACREAAIADGGMFIAELHRAVEDEAAEGAKWFLDRIRALEPSRGG